MTQDGGTEEVDSLRPLRTYEKKNTGLPRNENGELLKLYTL